MHTAKVLAPAFLLLGVCLGLARLVFRIPADVAALLIWRGRAR